MNETYIFPACSYATTCKLNKSCIRTPTTTIHQDYHNQNEPVEYMFIGDHAGMREIKTKRVFSGTDGDILRSALRKYLPNSAYTLSYLVRGWPVEWDTVGNGDYYKVNGGLEGANAESLRKARTLSFSNHPDKESVIGACSGFIDEDIRKLQPKILVLMGNTVLTSFFPREHRSMYEIAKANLTYMGIPVKVIPNPVMILRNPSSKVGWEKQLRIALFGDSGANSNNSIATSHNTLKTVPEVSDYVDHLMNNHTEVAVDTETLNLNKRYGNMLGMVQFSEDQRTGYAIPYQHPESPFGPDELVQVKELLFKLFNQPSKVLRWVCHNAKFECNILRTAIGTQILSAPIFDTQAGAFLLDENRTSRAAEFRYGIYTLKQLAVDYLGFDGYDKGILAAREEGNLWDLKLEDLSIYGCMDTSVTYALYRAELEEAKRQDYSAQLLDLMYYFYTPVIRLFSDIEHNGSPVNLKHLRNLISSKSPLLTEIEEIIAGIKKDPIVQRVNERLLIEGNKVGGHRILPLGAKPWIFDFAKKGHPQALFFNEMRLKAGRHSEKTGIASVDDEWQKANVNNPLVNKFATWVELRKMYDSFAKQMYDFVDPVSGDQDCKTDCRVRPGYLLSSVVTGRIACRRPNLQAIPRSDTPAKTAIKNMFQSEPGKAMVQLDYKANEIRWVGILAQDATLAQAINAGEAAMLEYKTNPSKELLARAEVLSDIHKQVGSMIFGIPIEQVTKKERQVSKACLGKGTLTVTSKGFKKIEDVEKGDYVWTGKEWTPVLDLHRPTAEVLTVRASRGWKCDVSEDHEITAFDRETLETKFVYVNDLIPGRHFIPIHRYQLEFPDAKVELAFKVYESTENGLPCPICNNEYGMLHFHMSQAHGISASEAKSQFGITRFMADSVVRGSAMTQSINGGIHPLYYPTEMTESVAWWLGCLVAEGGSSVTKKFGNLAFFQKKDLVYFDEYCRVHEELFGVYPTVDIDKRSNVKRACSSTFIRQFAEYCGYSSGAEFKEVPWSVLQSAPTIQAAFIRGYMSGDGSSPKTGVRSIKAVSKSELLPKHLSVMLWNMGIANSVFSEMHKLPKKDTRELYWGVIITGPDTDVYFDVVGESHNIKSRERQARHQKDFVPGVLAALRAVKEKHSSKFNIHDNNHVLKELSIIEICAHFHRYKEFLISVGELELLEKIKSVLGNDFFYAEVLEVVETDRNEMVYDLVLNSEHPWFVANSVRHMDCAFGILYDSSIKSIAEAQGKPEEEVSMWFDLFFDKFPMVKVWKEKMKSMASQKSYVETPHGRRRRFPIFDLYRNEDGYFNPNAVPNDFRSVVSEALRQASNAPVQGIASDAGMLGSALFQNEVRRLNLPVLVQNAVHDSCLYQCDVDIVKDTMRIAERCFVQGVMEHMSSVWGINFLLPLGVDYELGTKWGQLHKVHAITDFELDPLIEKVIGELKETYG